MATSGLLLLHAFSRREGSTPNCCADYDHQETRTGTSQVLLDANLLADDSGYLELGLTVVSPDGRLLAYSVDRTGDEVYRLRFRDLESGDDLADEVPRTYYGGAWSADSDLFFYTVHDEAYRPFQVWRHAHRHARTTRTCWCSRSPTSGSS